MFAFFIETCCSPDFSFWSWFHFYCPRSSKCSVALIVSVTDKDKIDKECVLNLLTFLFNWTKIYIRVIIGKVKVKNLIHQCISQCTTNHGLPSLCHTADVSANTLMTPPATVIDWLAWKVKVKIKKTLI